jgi:chromosome partitioning protein
MGRKQPLRSIVLANSKGGVGKTTLAAALAVRAAQESDRVALIDLDPQESISSWWSRRGKVANPKLFELDATTEAIEMLLAEGWAYAFIDTPPSDIPRIESGIAVADLCLIPVRPSALDLEQVDIVSELAEAHDVPAVFVLNHADPRWKLTRTAGAYLSRGGKPVLEPPISFRQAHMTAATVGKSGAELDSDGTTAHEIDQLWATVIKLLAQQRRAR